MLNFEVTSKTYAVEIPPEKFKKFIEYDYDSEQFEYDLRNLWAFNIEYDGHYLNYIYFTLNNDHDADSYLTKIIERIQEEVDNM